jgi:alkylated DNA repair dioxygenase AlkB
MPVEQTNLFGAGPSPHFPEGFQYHENTIAGEDETLFIKQLAVMPFKEFQFHGFEGKRRVVLFGWRYDFGEHKLSKADTIPAFLMDFYIRVQAAAGFAMHSVQQALVTEYTPGAGIGWHKDRPVFKQVMGISLASSCVLRMIRRLGDKWQRASIQVAPRSAYFFDGPGRWEWEHSIPPVENLRYSITFRNLRPPSARAGQL